MSEKRRFPTWAVVGLAALVAGTALCTVVPLIDRHPQEFIGAFLACAMPFALLVTFIAFIATAGKRSRRLCGFCGYDRVGLMNDQSCPECGRPYSPDAPGYKAVGRRPIPAWIWLPALLPIPAMLLVRFAGEFGGYYMLGCFGTLVAVLLGAAVHSWRQAR
jgi:hypothetical protein